MRDDPIANAISAIKRLLGPPGVLVTVRYAHPERRLMASYRQGVPLGLYAPGLSDGITATTAPELWPVLVMPDGRDPAGERIPLANIEQIEIAGGLHTARFQHGRKDAMITSVPPSRRTR